MVVFLFLFLFLLFVQVSSRSKATYTRTHTHTADRNGFESVRHFRFFCALLLLLWLCMHVLLSSLCKSQMVEFSRRHHHHHHDLGKHGHRRRLESRHDSPSRSRVHGAATSFFFDFFSTDARSLIAIKMKHFSLFSNQFKFMTLVSLLSKLFFLFSSFFISTAPFF